MSSNCSNSTSHVASLAFTLFHSLVFVAGLLLNSMAAWVFFQIRAKKRTFMLYLRNMVAADLLMTLTLPVTILSDANMGPTWIKVVSCRYTAVLFYCSMYASILFLGLLALDRYLKIVRPFGGKCGDCLYSYSFTKAMAAMVWLAMLMLSLPNSILSNKEPQAEIHRCEDLKSELGVSWHGGVVYINTGIFYTVLVTLVTCYISIFRQIRLSSAQFVKGGQASQRQEKSGQNILVVLVVFFVCFVPYHLWRIPFTLTQIGVTFSQNVMCILRTGKKITLLMSCCNVCLDPIIYFLMSKSFRIKLTGMLGFHTLRQESKIYTGKRTVLIFKENSSLSSSS